MASENRIEESHVFPECDVVILARLAEYLNRQNLHCLYRNLVGPVNYSLNVGSLRSNSPAHQELEFLIKRTPRLALFGALISDLSVAKDSLISSDLDLAESLEKAGFLRKRSDRFFAPQLQLISAFDLWLFVDKRLNYQSESIHDVYIGPDSYLLAQYLASSRQHPNERVLDLCTGTGLIGLNSANLGARVVSTDIAGEALELTAINCSLNGLEPTVTIRRERLETTLEQDPGRYDAIACNPPFVASPDGYESTVYAKGPDKDGLGYLRKILSQGRRLLPDKGRIVLIADLPGGNENPHFLQELEQIACSVRYRVDVFIDNVIPASANEQAMVNFLTLQSGSEHANEVQSDVRALYRDILRADKFFLTTIIARKTTEAPEFRVFNRFGRDKFFNKVRV